MPSDLDEFGATIFGGLDEFGHVVFNGINEMGYHIFEKTQSIETRNISDSGTGNDSIPHIEIKVQDEGKCIT